MYIAITPQQMGNTYRSSVRDYVSYLEKEDAERNVLEREHFFDQHNDSIASETVIAEIDGNTAKLKKKEPKFYSLIVSPSKRELATIKNDPKVLRKYVRELMKDYAKAFNRENPVSVDDIKYYAKIEHERIFKGFDAKVKENEPFRKEVSKLRNDIRKVERGELKGNVKKLERRIRKLEKMAPHKIEGKMVVPGMKKEGSQMHVHIIVSRKDASNTHSLSPGSKYRASEAELNGKMVKRGFDRVQFFEAAEKTFDKMTGHQRNFVETFKAKKTLIKNPKAFYAKLLGLPVSERALAFKLLGRTGASLPSIPKNQIALEVKTFKKLKKVLHNARKAGEIEI